MKVFSGLIALMLIYNLLNATEIVGKVVEVTDGDTIKIIKYLDNGQKLFYKVRLMNIDAPKVGQDFSKKSKRMLANLISQQWVYVEANKKDKYGRYIGTVYFDNKNINYEQVKNGMAWVDRKYCNDSTYYDLEKEARDNYRGIWSQPDPIPPWDYTTNKNYSSKSQPTKRYKNSYTPKYKRYSSPSYHLVASKPISSGGFKCEGKRYCRQMNSCKEAYFYLNECGLYRLDGDSDGVPCESICGHY